MKVFFKMYGKEMKEMENAEFVDFMMELCKAVQASGGDWSKFYEENVEVISIKEA